MELSVKFTKEELGLIARALTFGIIHTQDERESEMYKYLERKINLLGQISALEESKKHLR